VLKKYRFPLEPSMAVPKEYQQKTFKAFYPAPKHRQSNFFNFNIFLKLFKSSETHLKKRSSSITIINLKNSLRNSRKTPSPPLTQPTPTKHQRRRTSSSFGEPHSQFRHRGERRRLRKTEKPIQGHAVQPSTFVLQAS